MVTNGYLWFLPLAANLAATESLGKIINAPIEVIFKMATNEKEE